MLTLYKNILKVILDKLRIELQDNLIDMYLFGSRARGNFDDKSDIDVLIIVKNRNSNISDKIIDIIVNEEIKAGLNFTPLIKDEKTFKLEQQHNTPFYQNIINEGIKI